MKFLPALNVPAALGIVLLLSFFQTCSASVTVYYVNGQNPLSASPTSLAPGTVYTGLSAYDPTVLPAPPPPGPDVVPTQFAIQLSSTVPQGASIAQKGAFFGFSIEMSVVNQVLGTNASVLQVPFLNLMANLQQRSGQVHIRVGGNTQETATLVDSTPDGRILEKDYAGITNPTQTPPLIFTPELLYMLSNISSLVDVRWHLGVPFNDSSNFRLAIAEQGQQILGDHLIGLQAGNEPDLYAAHDHRAQTYGPFDYFGEFGQLIQAMQADSNIGNKNLLIGPSIATTWRPEDVWDTGFIDSYSANLAFLAVERYPTDNCAVKFPGSGAAFNNATLAFPTFLTHNAALDLVSTYIPSAQLAQQKGKPFLMFETNTASCGGFPGISDAFGAALWGIDYAMQMAAVGFSGALFHVGGQSVSYNPFTPPPTNQSTFHQWTIGPIYYSALIMAEALGPTNTSQVTDLAPNNNNSFTPGYGIWENGNLARVLLINFVSDSTGASDVNVDLSLADGQMPDQVQVKYLEAASVSQKGNFTWAGQTFGANFESDGRPMGTESVQTITCSSTTGTSTCTIHVPAPGAALVFLSSAAPTETAGAQSQTFSTTVITKLHNTVTVDPAVLATSNGNSGLDKELGSTSPGSTSAAESVRARVRSAVLGGGVMLGLAGVAGLLVLGVN